MEEEEKKNRVSKGEDVQEENEEQVHAMNIQKVFRAFRARVFVDDMRDDELAFLGMAHKPSPEDDPIAI